MCMLYVESCCLFSVMRRTCSNYHHFFSPHRVIIPCIFVLPAILGAITLGFSCICYFIAAINGEEWKAPSLAWGPGATKKDDTPKVSATVVNGALYYVCI